MALCVYLLRPQLHSAFQKYNLHFFWVDIQWAIQSNEWIKYLLITCYMGKTIGLHNVFFLLQFGADVALMVFVTYYN